MLCGNRTKLIFSSLYRTFEIMQIHDPCNLCFIYSIPDFYRKRKDQAKSQGHHRKKASSAHTTVPPFISPGRCILKIQFCSKFYAENMGCLIFAKLPNPLVRFCPILLDLPHPPPKIGHHLIT